jgi:superfamily II DNA/RNA helicase
MQNQKNIQEIVSNLGIEHLNLIQEEALVSIQNEAETLLLAPTGSGKTIAFLMPIFTMLNKETKGVQCLVLAPSRELAIQIEQVWKKMSTGFKVNVCYGGHNMQVEIQNFVEPPALLIGTPGRIMDHLTRRSVDLSQVKTIVFDEFDKALALGFQEQMSYIMRCLKQLNKKVLVSATAQIMIPEFVNVKNPRVLDFSSTFEDVSQLKIFTVMSDNKDKIDCLFQLVCNLGAVSTIIFCNHREAVERTSLLLWEMGVENAFFHGGMDQIDRERTLLQFRNGSTHFLVASDLAARGLDISSIQNVIHYHLPHKNEEFVHRNGRTARMNAEGNAFVILHKDEPKPMYLDKNTEAYEMQDDLTPPKRSLWATIYINGGKKDKLSKGDIVGFLAKIGGLEKEDIGMIELMDFMSFAAIKKSKIKTVLPIIQQGKLKGNKYKIQVTELNR